MNIEAQPRAPKVYYKSMPTPPPPPVKPGKMVHSPKIFNPVGHIYGFSIPGHNITFNFCTNGRVYREGDYIGFPYSINGNMISVYSNHGPQRIIGKGKISPNGMNIEWKEFSNGAKYRLRLMG